MRYTRMNYWYVARPNELFLDIDNVSKSIRHARARLQGAIECGKLDVAHVMQRPSRSKDHLHAIVILNRSICYIERCVWEVILHGDIYRGCSNLMRAFNNVAAYDILISPWPCFNFQDEKDDDRNLTYKQRDHDDFCNCPTKHTAAVMLACPAAKRLRGEMHAVGFFGKPSKNPCTIWPDL